MPIRKSACLAWIAALVALSGCMGGKLDVRPPMEADAAGRVLIDDFQDAPPGPGLPPAWRKLVFYSEKGRTEFCVEQEDGNRFMRTHADDAASAVICEASVDLEATPVMTWRWRVSGVPQGADPRYKKTEDTAGRVFVMFDYDPRRIGLGMRALYQGAAMTYGEYPPLYSLVYVWSTDNEPGTMFDNPHFGNAVIFVLESGEEKAGEWVVERRNILEDFREAFGDEAPTPVEGIGVVTDTDDLHGEVTTDYDAFMFLPADEPASSSQ